MAKIKGKAVAWLSSSREIDAGVVASGIDPDLAVQQFIYSNPGNDMSDLGWVRMGNAVITVDLPNREEIVMNQVSSLEEQARSVKADAQRQINMIQERISKLQALTFDDH